MNTLELSTTLRTIISALHKGLRKQVYSEHNYSLTEMATIGYLMRNEKLLPTELAGFTRVKTQSMSQILKKLESNGMIKRVPSKEDKRKVFIALTPFGKKMVEKTRYDRDEWLKELIEKKLSVKEITLLENTVAVLNKLL
jgi:DNA-binding MarR family transcriptional regulator